MGRQTSREMLGLLAVAGAVLIAKAGGAPIDECDAYCPSPCVPDAVLGLPVCPLGTLSTGVATYAGATSAASGVITADPCNTSLKNLEESCRDSATFTYRITTGPEYLYLNAASTCTGGSNFDTVITIVNAANDECVAHNDDHDNDETCNDTTHAHLEAVRLRPLTTYFINVCGWGSEPGSVGDFTLVLDVENHLTEEQACNGSCPGSCVWDTAIPGGHWVCPLGGLALDWEASSKIVMSGDNSHAGVLPTGYADTGDCSDKDTSIGCSGHPTVTYRTTPQQATYLNYASTCVASGSAATDTQITLSTSSGTCTAHSDDVDPSNSSNVEGHVDNEFCADLPGPSALLPGGSPVYLHVCGYGGAVGTFDMQMAFTATSAPPSPPPTPLPPTGSVSGDPHFIGFDGIKYDYVGLPGTFFNIITSPRYQLNGLLAPELYNGLTYMSAIGLATSEGQRIKVAAIPDMPYLMVEIDDIIMEHEELLGDGITYDGCTIQALESGSIRVRSPDLEVVVHLHKGEFVDLDTIDLLTAPDDAMHGVLGQTAASDFVGFEGKETDYIVSGMWSSDFGYDAFRGVGGVEAGNMSRNQHKGKRSMGARKAVRQIVDNAPMKYRSARAFNEE